MPGFSVMLAGMRPGARKALGNSLKDALNLTQQVADQIVGLIPVVLFSDLDRKQAQSIVETLAPIGDAGGKLAVSNAPPGAMRAINWPKAPAIYGRSVGSFAGGAAPTSAPAMPSAPPPAAHAAPAGTARGVATKCPVCGASLFLAATSGVAAPSPAPNRPPSAPPTAQRRKPPTRPPAPPSPGDMSTGLTPRPGTLPAARPSPAAAKPASGGVIIEEVGSIDDLDLGGPPPDVPVLPANRNVPAPAAAQQSNRAVAPALAPMDLDDFEAGLLGGGEDQLLAELDANLPAESASDDLLAELDELPGIEVQAEPAESNVPGNAPAPGPAGPEPGEWNVFAAKAPGVDLASAISQVMGISAAEAAEMAKKPVVPVAKNVSKATAEQIRDKLATVNVKARLSRKARSSRGKRR